MDKQQGELSCLKPMNISHKPNIQKGLKKIPKNTDMQGKNFQ